MPPFIISDIPNTSESVNGINFRNDRGQMVSEEVDQATADYFASIPGYKVVDKIPKKEGDAGGKGGRSQQPGGKKSEQTVAATGAPVGGSQQEGAGEDAKSDALPSNSGQSSEASQQGQSADQQSSAEGQGSAPSGEGGSPDQSQATGSGQQSGDGKAGKRNNNR